MAAPTSAAMAEITDAFMEHPHFAIHLSILTGHVFFDLAIRAQTARTTEAEVIREVAQTTVRMDGQMPLCAGLVAITHRIDTASQRIDFGHARSLNGVSVRGPVPVRGMSLRE